MLMNVVSILLCCSSLVNSIHWSVRDEKGGACMLLSANNATNGMLRIHKDGVVDELKFNIMNGSASGSCSKGETQQMFVSFTPQIRNSSTGIWNLTISFSKSDSGAEYNISDFKMDAMVNGKEVSFAINRDAYMEITAGNQTAYKCSHTRFLFNNGSSIDFMDLRVIAFGNLNSTDFASEQQYEICSLDSRTSELVPIIVGICLSVLVVAVLIAYIIGRVRAKREGYASV